MITIKGTLKSIQVEGHANFAEHGTDIVCAGISALAQTLIQSLEELTTAEMRYTIQSGLIEVNFRHLSREACVLIDAFFIGCKSIADKYPENVTVSRAGTL